MKRIGAVGNLKKPKTFAADERGLPQIENKKGRCDKPNTDRPQARAPTVPVRATAARSAAPAPELHRRINSYWVGAGNASANAQVSNCQSLAVSAILAIARLALLFDDSGSEAETANRVTS